ncbi:MAG: NAD(P)-binding domain-containing protein [Bdellovibrionales bacterium]|nr:NAD(P)-binding domain-containing protein [Bdellovibrionales bacterium]
MKISIIGLGWFGEALAGELSSQHDVWGTTRSEDKISEFQKKNITAEKLTVSDSPSEKLLSADVIVLNIPPFHEQLSWFKSWPWNKQAHLIFISSTSVYGKNTGFVDETILPMPETENARILLEEENWIKFFPVHTIIRFGGLIGLNRHPGKSLSGRANIAGGNLPVNLIHLEDCLGFVKTVIDQKLANETFNLAHPDHPSRRDYYQKYCLEQNLTRPEFNDSLESGKIISHDKVSKFYKFSHKL